MRRDQAPDILKGISIIGVVLIHAYGLFLDSDVNFFIWNWMHFVVVGFVFSSGYVLNMSKNLPGTFSESLPWFKKRLIRLLYPYYLYFGIHLVLMLFFPSYFSGYGIKLEFGYIVQSLLLTGGIGLSWIPALFVQMMILFPVLHYLYTKRRKYFTLFMLLSFLSTLLLLFLSFPDLNFRISMIIPWGFVLGLGIVVYNLKEEVKNKIILLSILTFTLIFINTHFLFLVLSASTTLTHHKYPPNIYYLSYALVLSLGIFYLARKRIFEHVRRPLKGKSQAVLSEALSYAGRNSYGLFFIHYLFLDFFTTSPLKYFFSSTGLRGTVDPFALAIYALICSTLALSVISKVKKSIRV